MLPSVAAAWLINTCAGGAKGWYRLVVGVLFIQAAVCWCQTSCPCCLGLGFSLCLINMYKECLIACATAFERRGERSPH